MPKQSHPPSNHEEVIERLISENTNANRLLDELKLMLAIEGQFSGLSLKGGFQALIKDYHKTQDKNRELVAANKKLSK